MINAQTLPRWEDFTASQSVVNKKQSNQRNINTRQHTTIVTILNLLKHCITA